MLSLEQAKRIACEGSRYDHSLRVGSIMRVLAKEWDQDPQLWEIVGVLHDIDYDETKDLKEMHGVKAAERLDGKIPVDALHAIKSHDYRTGVKPVSRLDNALIFSDGLAHIFSSLDEKTEFSYSRFEEVVEQVTKAGRSWMLDIIQKYISDNDLTHGIIEKLWDSSRGNLSRI